MIYLRLYRTFKHIKKVTNITSLVLLGALTLTNLSMNFYNEKREPKPEKRSFGEAFELPKIKAYSIGDVKQYAKDLEGIQKFFRTKLQEDSSWYLSNKVDSWPITDKDIEELKLKIFPYLRRELPFEIKNPKILRKRFKKNYLGEWCLKGLKECPKESTIFLEERQTKTRLFSVLPHELAHAQGEFGHIKVVLNKEELYYNLQPFFDNENIANLLSFEVLANMSLNGDLHAAYPLTSKLYRLVQEEAYKYEPDSNKWKDLTKNEYINAALATLPILRGELEGVFFLKFDGLKEFLGKAVSQYKAGELIPIVIPSLPAGYNIVKEGNKISQKIGRSIRTFSWGYRVIQFREGEFLPAVFEFRKHTFGADCVLETPKDTYKDKGCNGMDDKDFFIDEQFSYPWFPGLIDSYISAIKSIGVLEKRPEENQNKSSLEQIISSK